MIHTALLALLLAQDVIRTDVVNVQIPVTVTDKNGKYLTDLTGSDFRLLDAGTVQQISVARSVLPISLVVAVQTTTIDPDVVKAVRKEAGLLAPLLAGNTGEISVVGYDHRIQVLTPFTTNATEVKAAFDMLTATRGPHRLDDAAIECIRMLQARGTERRKILLIIGEGFDLGSTAKTDNLFTQAELNGILVYAANMQPRTALGPAGARNPIPAEARAPLPMGVMRTETYDVQTGGYGPDIIAQLRGKGDDLSAYAQFTGARAQSFSNRKTLQRIIETISKEIHNQYMLTFAPQNKQPGYHRITVEVPSTPNPRIRARQGYWIAAQAEVP
jgi:VWFA-related protein